MEIIVGILIGAVLGAIGHFALPGQRLRGAVLGPAVGAAASGITWAALTWLGWSFQDPWIWMTTVSAAIGAVLVVLTVLNRVRTRRDEHEKARLRIA